MRDHESKARVIRQVRRTLIDTLKQVHPGSLSFESLRYVLPTVEVQHLKSDVAYLVQKKLVECTNERPNQQADDKEYGLTAAGVEQADRINIDPALEP